MKIRQEEVSGSRGNRKVKRRMFLKKPKADARARLNRRSVKSDDLAEKIDFGSERNQDPGPSNRRRSGAGQAVSNCNSLEVDKECFVAVKRLTLAKIEEMKINLAKRRIKQLPEEVWHNILGFVTFADVKSARLANKQWRQVTTTPLRRASKQITLDNSVIDFITKMGNGEFPIYRLKIRLDEGAYWNSREAEICSSYFPAICDWVKELTLEMDINYDPRNQKKIEDKLPRDCVYKDLTHVNLHLIQNTALTREFWKRFKDFVCSILENSSNLREVSVRYESYWKGRDEWLPICPVIEDLFVIESSKKLSYINFEDVPLEKIDLVKWSTLNLKLKKLEICVSSTTSTLNDLLIKFLETQTRTLQQLKLRFYMTRWFSELPTLTFTFPRMEKLELLRFRSMHSDMVTILGIDYVGLFPCLKELHLHFGMDCMEFFGNSLLEPTNSMEKLVLPSNVGEDAMVAAARLFPSLRKLEIPANSLLTKVVYGSMPNLEVLSLTGYNLPLDSIITGLDFAECQMFQGVLTETWIEKIKTAEGRSMACLQKLKTFKFSNEGRKLICFSRLSFHVFQQMSSLKTLELKRKAEADSPDEHEIQFMMDLREKFNVLTQHQ